MTRVDLPKNKSKLCQTFSLCFWFGTTKWITKEIFRVHTAGIVLNLKWELNKLNMGAVSTVYIFHHGRKAELHLSLCSLALRRQWSHRRFFQALLTLSICHPPFICFFMQLPHKLFSLAAPFPTPPKKLPLPQDNSVLVKRLRTVALSILIKIFQAV